MTTHLSPVISVDANRCTNCHACISACPVKYCMDGSGSTISINHDLCIGCGSCITACTHEARSWVDDWEEFRAALARREPIVAISAPSVVASFPDTYLNLNGYLESIGVSAVFDVSFGAELTVLSYLDHLKTNQPSLIIAQPCPAIVSYVEIYRPELLPYLAPADSPMLHTIKMIRRYFPEYRRHKFAVLSPCLAKKREFDEVGADVYNVAIRSLEKHLRAQRIDLSAFPRREFANPDAERAVTFSTPGGLLQTAEREMPGIRLRTRKIEGPRTIYPYLEELAREVKSGTHPLLLDCLNCELGCNGGPGTSNAGKMPDVLERPIEKRREELKAKYRRRFPFRRTTNLKRTLAGFWDKTLYERKYVDRSDNDSLKIPSSEQAASIHRSMRKFSDADFYNCSACGYNSCEGMTTAIFNGLNKSENCHHYLRTATLEEHESVVAFNNELNVQVQGIEATISTMSKLVEELDGQMYGVFAFINQSSAAVEELVSTINTTSRISTEKGQAAESLVHSAERGRASMDGTIEAIAEISKSVGAIADAIEVIDAVASNTNLLSMNAAIEAAHAGEAGRGFAVVAGEIRRLSEATGEHSRSISRALNSIIGSVSTTSTRSAETGDAIRGIGEEIRSVADAMSEFVGTMTEMSAGTGQVTAALTELRTFASDLRDRYQQMTAIVRTLNESVREIGNSSDRTPDAPASST